MTNIEASVCLQAALVSAAGVNLNYLKVYTQRHQINQRGSEMIKVRTFFFLFRLFLPPLI